ncbi:MAG TPA: hypothetical protein VJ183_20065 [Chloroflexia bacterium]|nr:hypothetical protein [Chloroflexia bacterium]
MGGDRDGEAWAAVSGYYRRGIPCIDLYVERNNRRTPRQGLFYIFERGQIVAGGFRSRAAADASYRELRDAAGCKPASRSVLTGEERQHGIAHEA